MLFGLECIQASGHCVGGLSHVQDINCSILGYNCRILSAAEDRSFTIYSLSNFVPTEVSDAQQNHHGEVRPI